MADSFRVLTVCTANICRSPLAAALLAQQLSEALPTGSGADVVVTSAGVAAMVGARACPRASELGGVPGVEHRSRQVTPAMAADADLILAMDRGHRGQLASLAPATRPRTFTALQAAGIARELAERLAVGDLPAGAPPLPAAADPVSRLRWLVAELDAGRGLAQPDPAPPEQQWEAGDIPDPHVQGDELHPAAAEAIASAAAALGSLAATVLARAGNAD